VRPISWVHYVGHAARKNGENAVRVAFAIDCVSKIAARQGKCCPYCGNPHTRLLARKKVIAQLRHCPDCELMFLWPKPTVATNNTLYQSAYYEGVVSDLPSRDDLACHIGNRFHGGILDYSGRISTVRELCSQGRLLDYGASWGYGVWQFRDAGYDAVGFEISRFRTLFGKERLGLEMVDSIGNLPAHSFNVIHSSHVLEHITDLRTTFEDFRKLLRPGGHLVVSVPNGAGRSARELGVNWGPMIGEKHVNALTQTFLGRALAGHGFICTFGPKDDDELHLIARLEG
jgi:SAM-dependent methyltransferase